VSSYFSISGGDFAVSDNGAVKLKSCCLAHWYVTRSVIGGSSVSKLKAFEKSVAFGWVVAVSRYPADLIRNLDILVGLTNYFVRSFYTFPIVFWWIAGMKLVIHSILFLLGKVDGEGYKWRCLWWLNSLTITSRAEFCFRMRRVLVSALRCVRG
jgi:hypothetical protein